MTPVVEPTESHLPEEYLTQRQYDRAKLLAERDPRHVQWTAQRRRERARWALAIAQRWLSRG